MRTPDTSASHFFAPLFFSCILSFLFVVPSSGPLYAQDFIDYVNRITYGFGWTHFQEKEVTDDEFHQEEAVANMGMISFGWTIPWYELTSRSSFAFDVQFNVGTAFHDDIGGAVFATAPFYLCYKYGADATYIVETHTGFGAGLGVYAGALLGDDGGTCALPSAFAEGAFVVGDDIWKLRASVPFGTISTDKVGELNFFTLNFLIIDDF